ncbi:CRISPR-associated ring nuclease [Thermogutta sp.]|uniref:CRISPR-associated ring nuclease n=1 Tax=Thermogutta sp. TaxID=1962930 RepID=UPI00321FA4DE
MSRTLLCTVGTSWAVAAEAAQLLGPGGFAAVHVLTSDGERTEESIRRLLEFFRRHPVPDLSITRVAGFTDLRNEEDHRRFEEVLYRWILAKAPDPGRRYVCLAGGYKTMSAAVQRAAGLFGAAEVFHVLCEPRFGENGSREASTLEEVEAAIESGALHFIKLGPEPGWPQLATLDAQRFPLETEGSGVVLRASSLDFRLSSYVNEVLEKARNLAARWEDLSELPFPSLATWPASTLAWLREPLDPRTDHSWVRSLPKVELHCHLGGFATHGELLREVRNAAAYPNQLPPLEEPEFPEGWPYPKSPIALDDYMRLGNATGSTLLKDPGCLRKQCELLYQALVDDNVVYAEIRCSPANYATADRSPWVVLQEIRETFQRAMDRAPENQRCHVNLILIATREEKGDRSRIAKHLALAITAAEHWKHGCRVVGVDLAGFENRDTRAAMFATDFEPVHRVGLAVTVHAGENDDVEGIWQAVFKLSARRLGHALHLEESPDLLRAVAERGIGVEMCPFANMQIKGFSLDGSGNARYPLLRYIHHGILVTANTDNIGISRGSLSENLLLLARLCTGISRLDILKLQSNAARVAFLSSRERQALLERLSRVPSVLHPEPLRITMSAKPTAEALEAPHGQTGKGI